MLQCVALLALAGSLSWDPSYDAAILAVEAKLPGGRVSLFGAVPPEVLAAQNQGPNYALVPTDEGTAIRVTVSERMPNAYAVELRTPPSKEPIAKGDVVFITFRARCIETRAETGAGTASLYVQGRGEPWPTLSSASASITKDWKTFSHHAPSEYSMDAGAFELTFHLAANPQTLEFKDLAVWKLPANTDVTKLPYNEITYPGREPDAPWRKAAAERIERYRKGDLRVVVRDERGNPVSDAEVRVRMTRHAYGFGTFLEGPTVDDNLDGERYRLGVKKLFNMGTVPVYNADWGWQGPEARERYKRITAWAHENGLRMRGHTLVWPAWNWLPASYRQLEGDPNALRKTIAEHVESVTQWARPFRYEAWDVMNEPRVNHDVMDLCGREVMKDWWDIAEKNTPWAKLFVNEYSILSGGGVDAAAHENLASVVEELQAMGARLGGIGMQSHFGEQLTPPSRLIEVLDRFAVYGVPIHITEFDVDMSDEKAQADYLRDFYTAVFSHPGTEAIVMWGFWEGQHWRPRAALYRKDWTPKPNGLAYEKLVLDEWWTDEMRKSGTDGSLSVRGFCGDYRVEAIVGTKSGFAVGSLSRDGAELVVTVR